MPLAHRSERVLVSLPSGSSGSSNTIDHSGHAQEAVWTIQATCMILRHRCIQVHAGPSNGLSRILQQPFVVELARQSDTKSTSVDILATYFDQRYAESGHHRHLRQLVCVREAVSNRHCRLRANVGRFAIEARTTTERVLWDKSTIRVADLRPRDVATCSYSPRNLSHSCSKGMHHFLKMKHLGLLFTACVISLTTARPTSGAAALKKLAPRSPEPLGGYSLPPLIPHTPVCSVNTPSD